MQTFRDSDIVGRVGGDEFAVVGLCDGRNAREALARLNEAVAAFNASTVQKFPLSFSVGIAERRQAAGKASRTLSPRPTPECTRTKRERSLVPYPRPQASIRLFRGPCP